MSRRDEILAALKAGNGGVVSGQQLADEQGVSRVAVSKHVSVLREMGYDIPAVAGVGYRLVSSPDVSIPTEVSPLLTDPMWVRVEGRMSTGSTNDDAKTLARAGAPEGTVVLAGVQTAGRGRLGREWVSAAGGGYASVVLRPVAAPVDLAPLALVVAVGVARGLETVGARPLLKWPNDIWLADPDGGEPVGKVAGILLEMFAESDRVEWIVAGVGIDVFAPAGRLDGAAYVADHVPGVRVPVVAAAALDGLAAAYREFTGGGFGRLVDEYERRSMLSGTQVRVADASGAERAAGVVAGVDADGRLLVDGPGGRVAVSSGDVTLRGSTG